MGKKDEFFKWYREHFDTMTFEERRTADTIVQAYVTYHDAIEKYIRGKMSGQQQLAWLEALAQMDWEDAKLIQDPNKNVYPFERYGKYKSLQDFYTAYIKRSNVNISFHPKKGARRDSSGFVEVTRTYHTKYGDVIASTGDNTLYADCYQFLSVLTPNYPEFEKRVYNYRHVQGHTEEEVCAAIKRGEFSTTKAEIPKEDDEDYEDWED